VSTGRLSHDVPAGPAVSTAAAGCGNTIDVTWTPVTGPAAILPEGDIHIAGYQVIVGSFQVTVPASATRVTIPEQYYASLATGVHDFEVLAIDESGNQTITQGTFTK
jgi:hypothetical protein